MVGGEKLSQSCQTLPKVLEAIGYFSKGRDVLYTEETRTTGLGGEAMGGRISGLLKEMATLAAALAPRHTGMSCRVSRFQPLRLLRQQSMNHPLGRLIPAFVLTVWSASSVCATRGGSLSGAFELEKLPPGKSVTIPRPATTWVPLAMRARLTATDMPQSLSLRLIGPTGAQLQGAPVKLAIYDPNSERVVYVTVTPGVSFVYNFRDLRPIMVVSEDPGSERRQAKLQVESNKPLELSH